MAFTGFGGRVGARGREVHLIKKSMYLRQESRSIYQFGLKSIGTSHHLQTSSSYNEFACNGF